MLLLEFYFLFLFLFVGFVCMCGVFFQNPANEGLFKEIFPETIKKGEKYSKKKKEQNIVQFSRNNYIIWSLFQENEKKLGISMIHTIKLHLDHQWSSQWPYNRYFVPVPNLQIYILFLGQLWPSTQLLTPCSY